MSKTINKNTLEISLQKTNAQYLSSLNQFVVVLSNFKKAYRISSSSAFSNIEIIELKNDETGVSKRFFKTHLRFEYYNKDIDHYLYFVNDVDKNI